MEYKPKIAVIGLGYVGLPVAVAMADKFNTLGYDAKKDRIRELQEGIDRNKTIEAQELKSSRLALSFDPKSLSDRDFFIVAVPTPVDSANVPDLGALAQACKMVGPALSKGAIVVFESTVYPGATEEVCVPLLEAAAGLVAGRDFFVGYSPERINPGDLERGFKDIKKVVSGQDEATLAKVAFVYESVVRAGVYRASSIKVAEAAKVIENTQRDLNIALMNELSLIFERIGIDTNEVLDAAATKWNFLKFVPGLVGGHCIGVDPYYLTHKAQALGYHPEVILAGRRINDSMGRNVAHRTIKALTRRGGVQHGALVNVLGLTFKENCPDIRNSKVFDVIKELAEYGVEVSVADPWVHEAEAFEEYGVRVEKMSSMRPAKALIVGVPHQQFRELRPTDLAAFLEPGGLVFDIKSIWSRNSLQNEGYEVLRL